MTNDAEIDLWIDQQAEARYVSAADFPLTADAPEPPGPQRHRRLAM